MSFLAMVSHRGTGKTLVLCPVDVVADIDILRDTTALKSIIESLGEDSTVILPLAKAVKDAIEQHKPWLNASRRESLGTRSTTDGDEGSHRSSAQDRPPQAAETLFVSLGRWKISGAGRKQGYWQLVESGEQVSDHVCSLEERNRNDPNFESERDSLTTRDLGTREQRSPHYEVNT